MATCNDHSGVCENIRNLKDRISDVEHFAEVKLSARTFYWVAGTLISICALLFGGIFSLNSQMYETVTKIGSNITKIETSMSARQVHIEHIQRDVQDIKAKLP